MFYPALLFNSMSRDMQAAVLKYWTAQSLVYRTPKAYSPCNPQYQAPCNLGLAKETQNSKNPEKFPSIASAGCHSAASTQAVIPLQCQSWAFMYVKRFSLLGQDFDLVRVSGDRLGLRVKPFIPLDPKT